MPRAYEPLNPALPCMDKGVLTAFLVSPHLFNFAVKSQNTLYILTRPHAEVRSYYTAWLLAGRPGFDFRQEKVIFSFATGSRLALGSRVYASFLMNKAARA
jgi:hypothetical protein